MQAFVTGGTGLMGSAVVAELLGAGHTVDVLARSDRSEQAVRAAGARPVRGSLSDLEVLRTAADDADGVLHLALPEQTGTADDAAREEAAALDVLRSTLRDSGRPLVLAAGTPWIQGRTATESDPLPTDGPVAARQRTVTETLAFADQGVRTAAVRIPRVAHEGARGGFADMLIRTARRDAVSGWVGDGTQRWPAVHVLDAAVLFRLVLEHAPAGTSWHAVQEEGVPMRDIAAVIGRRLGLPARRVPQESFGALGAICALDQPASGAHTREALGWVPVHARLLDDLEHLEP